MPHENYFTFLVLQDTIIIIIHFAVQNIQHMISSVKSQSSIRHDCITDTVKLSDIIWVKAWI